jgi:16S rRNA (cytidine1402-2'-O)-methyltransferase
VENVKGEIVLVIGPPEEKQPAAADVDAILIDLSKTMPTAKAAAEAAKLTGLPRKELYQRLLDMKGSDGR